MSIRFLTACGLALVCAAALTLVKLPWVALGCAVAAFVLGCVLHRRRNQTTSDGLQFCRVLLVGASVIEVLGALITTDTPLKWIIWGPVSIPAAVWYFFGFNTFFIFYAIGSLFLFVIILASEPQKGDGKS